MSEQKDSFESLTADQLERKKLSLEIRQLERQNSWTDKLIRLGSVMTTLVAVAGLVLTAWNTERNRKIEEAARMRNEVLDRVNKIQTQIRADKEQILEFVTNEKISAIRVAFLLDDLKSLTEQLPRNETENDANQQGKLEKEAKESVTELLRQAAWELRFDERRHFDFDLYALERWNNYRQLWKDRPSEHLYFLVNKYHLRLQKLRSDDPPCIEKLNYEQGTTILTYKSAGTACDQGLIGALVHTFGDHLKVMREANQSGPLNQETQEFTRLTNPDFAKNFFAKL